MKLAIVLLSVLCWASAEATAMTASELVQLDKPARFFVVDYDYDTEWSFVPTTNPLGPPHYGADFVVYEVIGGEREEVGISSGQYIGRGERCFDADPRQHVLEVLGGKGTDIGEGCSICRGNGSLEIDCGEEHNKCVGKREVDVIDDSDSTNATDITVDCVGGANCATTGSVSSSCTTKELVGALEEALGMIRYQNSIPYDIVTDVNLDIRLPADELRNQADAMEAHDKKLDELKVVLEKCGWVKPKAETNVTLDQGGTNWVIDADDSMTLEYHYDPGVEIMIDLGCGEGKVYVLDPHEGIVCRCPSSALNETDTNPPECSDD